MFLEDKALGPISEEEWARFRREQLQELPEALQGMDLPSVLMPKQAEFIGAIYDNSVVVADKSRRVGFTWGLGSGAVLTAGAAKTAGGMDVLYIGYNLDMAREFIDCCAMWAKAFLPAITEVGEFLFTEIDPKGEPRGIQAFRIGFASGFEIVALSSRPRSLRGRQGLVVLDEFAFHDDAEGLLKAAMAFLIWGGKVVVVSTHNGFDNPFNKLIQDIHSGEQPGAVVRCTFDDAVAQGLYQRICLIQGKEWSPEAEAEWRAKIYRTYRHNADEELRCIPSSSAGAYLSGALIEARMDAAIPIIRWKAPKGFVDEPELVRITAVRDFCRSEILPHLERLDPARRSVFGQDFGREGDLTVIHPLQITKLLHRHTPFLLELREVPFESQKQIMFYIVDRLPRFSHGALDAGGNGASHAEAARQKYGSSVISEVKFTPDWYIRNMPKLKAAFEDGSFDLPKDDDVLQDYRAIKMTQGVAKIPANARTEGKDGFQRHGDAAIAGALAIFASHQNTGLIGASTLGVPRDAPTLFEGYAFSGDDLSVAAELDDFRSM